MGIETAHTKENPTVKKTILVTTLVVLALAMLGIGSVFAQGAQPPVQRGWMHDYLEQALAAKLGLTEAQVEDQFAAGKTMYQIAIDNGIQEADLTTFIFEVHQEAFSNAVEDGVITQQQADWMLQRMQNRGGNGSGNCPMHNGQSSFGSGRGYGPGMMQNGGYGPGIMGGWGAQTP
jgi:hypothetical protein